MDAIVGGPIVIQFGYEPTLLLNVTVTRTHLFVALFPGRCHAPTVPVALVAHPYPGRFSSSFGRLYGCHMRFHTCPPPLCYVPSCYPIPHDFTPRTGFTPLRWLVVPHVALLFIATVPGSVWITRSHLHYVPRVAVPG